MSYIVTSRKSGLQVEPGAIITNFRNEAQVFKGVTRGPEYNGTAKVATNKGEFYAHVFDLKVERFFA